MTPTSIILGGFSKSWRKELESEIWLMAPLYHRVWYWLRMNMQHELFLFPTRGKFGIWVLPGQRITSLQQIADGVKWIEWGKERVPNKKTIVAVLDWLVSREMVTVESNSKGTLISLVNWSTYNGNSSKKVTAESNTEYTRSGHKGEGIEGIEVKSKTLSASLDAEQEEPDFYLTAKKRKLTGERLSTFNQFMDVFKDKRGRAQAADAWIDIKPLTRSIFTKIIEAAERYAAERPLMLADKRTPKMAQGWISDKRWEDETLANSCPMSQPDAVSAVSPDQSARIQAAISKKEKALYVGA